MKCSHSVIALKGRLREGAVKRRRAGGGLSFVNII